MSRAPGRPPVVKSDIWEKDVCDKVVSGFAACKQVNKGFAFDSREMGTSSPRKHVEHYESTAAAVTTW